MRRGYFAVTKEIREDSIWPMIEEELKKVFTVEVTKEQPFGIVEYHGTSYLFDEVPECASNKYDVIFKTENNKPVFLKFEHAN